MELQLVTPKLLHIYINKMCEEAHNYTVVPVSHITSFYFMTACTRSGHNAACTHHWCGSQELPVKIKYSSILHGQKANHEQCFKRYSTEGRLTTETSLW